MLDAAMLIGDASIPVQGAAMQDGSMGQEDDKPVTATGAADDMAATSRRRLLIAGGAVAGSAIVSIRPALAQTAASVLNCQIPVPDPSRSGGMIAADGSVVPAGTAGAFPAPGRAFTGEEVKAALGGRSLPGTSYEQNRAYLNYIRRLQSGTSGFTCYASLQMPR
jgi:hypothetical protein